MSNLTIHLQEKAFREIRANEKHVVLQERNSHWRNLLEGRRYETVTFTNGFPHVKDSTNQIECEYRGYEIQEVILWGDTPIEVFAIYTPTYTKPANELDLFPEMS